MRCGPRGRYDALVSEGAADRETPAVRPPGPECSDGVVLDTLRAVGYGSPGPRAGLQPVGARTRPARPSPWRSVTGRGMEGETMRADTKAARRLPAEPLSPPPTHQVHDVTVRLPHDVYELAVYAHGFEEREGLHLGGRTFEAFLADVIEGGLELPVTRWQHQPA